MLLQEKIPIAADVTAGDLHDRLAPLGARLIVTALEQLAQGTLRPTPQPALGATYAKKITKAEARLDWSRPAIELLRQVLAFNPAPVAWTELSGDRVRVFRAGVAGSAAGAAPGSVLSADAHGIHVATGDGVLAITELQWPGGRRLSAAEAAAGRSLGCARFG